MLIKRFILFIFLLFNLFLTQAFATSIPTLTLRDAIFLSLRYNPNIRSAEFTRILDKFDLRLAHNSFELHYALAGNASFQHNITNGESTRSSTLSLTPDLSWQNAYGGTASLQFQNDETSDYYPQLTLDYKQHLLRGARPTVVQAPLFDAIDNEKINRLNLKNTIISNISQVIVSYRSLVQAENALVIQQQALKRAEQTLTTTEQQIKAGASATADLAQTQLGVSQANLGIVTAENAVFQSKETLLQNIGLDPSVSINIPTTVQIIPFKIPTLQQSIALALKNDPTYQGDLIQLGKTKRSLLVANDNSLWQLDADAKKTWNSTVGGAPNQGFNNLLNSRNSNQSLTLTLNIPIDDYQIKQGIISARVALKKQQIQTEFERNTVVSNVISQYKQLEAAQKAIDFAMQSEQLAEKNLSNTYIQYKYGRATILAVSQQQQSLTGAQQNLISSQINYLNTVTSFQQLIQTTLDYWGIKVRY
jgi:outer membrane protein TolC